MDNYFHSCPPMMQDQGRQLSDFKSDTRRNEYIKYINNIWRDDQYRLFLQTNGKQILDNEWQFHKTNNRCFVNDCVHVYPTVQTQSQFVLERQAHDSMFNPKTFDKFKNLRQCSNYQDYRLNPK